MAKSRLSGGYCGNAVVTRGVSDGSGTSGRLDTEITVSEEDNQISGRKCISLDLSRRGVYGVPMQIVPLSKVSARQRNDLIHRFKSELERVQLFQKKFEMQKRNSGTLSSSSIDIISCNNGQNRHQIENSRKPSISGSVPGNRLKPLSETSRLPSKTGSVPGNKMKQLDQNLKPRGLNRGSDGKFETPALARTCLTGMANALFMKDCELLLKRLMNHQYSWVFNTPVDVVKLNLPDYFAVIKHPMDLGTVKDKIAKGSYTSPLDFAADVRLTFSNAMTYNPRGNNVHTMADTLSKYFEVRWKTIQKKLPRIDSLQLPMKTKTFEDVKTTKPMPLSKKRKVDTPPPQPEIIVPPQPEISVPPQPDVIPSTKQVISDQEKKNIGRELESFQGDIPAHIIDFLNEHSSNDKDCEEDEIEIDIDDLSDDTLLKLRKLLNKSLLEKQKNQKNDEACEIEILNDSGPSNSSLQVFKGNDLEDEEVDIGGDSPPFSSYPPVEIEKDATYQRSKCSSPGSSDTDSSSSSDIESDDVKARLEELVKVPENMGPCARMDLNTKVAHSSEINQSVNGIDKLEDKSQQKPNSCESDHYQDGNCGSTERLYRAAVLKNRFADTILKAREKTMAQGKKGDPEKLRREKEKVEMEQQKEKARIQAEAKAAEAARRRAEAKAATEAKRKRELEREAARQALRQIEKTVEINENSQFLDDISHHGMDSFKFGGNPLEQLGLYIKDDDEEEEGEPLCVSNPVNDVEEGEID